MEAKINAGNTKHAQATLNCILKGESETTGVHHYNVLGKKKKKTYQNPTRLLFGCFQVAFSQSIMYLHTSRMCHKLAQERINRKLKQS